MKPPRNKPIYCVIMYTGRRVLTRILRFANLAEYHAHAMKYQAWSRYEHYVYETPRGHAIRLLGCWWNEASRKRLDFAPELTGTCT